VWAACLRAAWPDPSLPPFPGADFAPQDITETCTALGADPDTVRTALDRALPAAHLITATGPRRRLGPATAALPTPAIDALRRAHHRLPRSTTPPGVMDERHTLAHAAVEEANGTQPPSEHLAHTLIAALETARGPLARSDLTPLADPAIRAQAAHALAGCGRQLLCTPEGNWITGYPDPVAQALIAEGSGVPSRAERAVLALVLLHTVAIPRARGHHRHARWANTSHPVTADELALNRAITKTTIRHALRKLRTAGLVAEAAPGRYIPGPALERLTAHRAEALWEDLILIGRPDGHLAAAIRQRRAAPRPPVPDLPAAGTA
jgi:DNA-binding transcriptional ArsR family regulator